MFQSFTTLPVITLPKVSKLNTNHDANSLSFFYLLFQIISIVFDKRPSAARTVTSAVSCKNEFYLD